MRKRWENQVCCTEYTTSIASGVIRKLIARALPDELEFPAEMQLSHPFFPDEESSPCAPAAAVRALHTTLWPNIPGLGLDKPWA
jgi:hypothetical protein